MKTTLLIALLLLPSCSLGDYAAEVGGRINDNVQFGVGYTRDASGWNYLGLKFRARPEEDGSE